MRLTPPGSAEDEEIVWVMESKHSLFHKQEGFVCSDPFATDREKQAHLRRLRLQLVTEKELIDLEEAESPFGGISDEDPFGPLGVRPNEESRRKWRLSGPLNRRSKQSEMSLCCWDAEEPTFALVMQGRVTDDGCESTF